MTSWNVAVGTSLFCAWVLGMTCIARFIFGIPTTGEVMLPSFGAWLVAALALLTHNMSDEG